jgi:hypothetical protein
MVEVSVMDLNDNPPMFVNQPYYAVVSKEAARDSQGMQMEIVKILIIKELTDKISGASPGCLSRILDPNFFRSGSEFFPFRILDPHQRI